MIDKLERLRKISIALIIISSLCVVMSIMCIITSLSHNNDNTSKENNEQFYETVELINELD